MSGLLDPVLVNAVGQAVRDAEAGKAKALVLQANSGGVVVSDSTYAALLRQIQRSSVPVDIWIGPSGSHLTGPSAQLLGVAREVGMAPGTSVGQLGPTRARACSSTRPTCRSCCGTAPSDRAAAAKLGRRRPGWHPRSVTSSSTCPASRPRR